MTNENLKLEIKELRKQNYEWEQKILSNKSIIHKNFSLLKKVNEHRYLLKHKSQCTATFLPTSCICTK